MRRCVLHEGQAFEIGRGRRVDIRLEALAVSRRHASIRLGPAGVVVEDLHSRNGTEVDGRPLESGEAVLVEPGSRIGIGPYEVVPKVLPGEDRQGPEERERVVELLRAEGVEARYCVGRGSTGSVWVGWSEQLARMVAVKLLDVRLAAESGEDRRRFLREARVCARLDSPHTIRLLDFRIAGDRPLLILEFVAGLSAMERLREGFLELDEVLGVGVHLARALAALEDAGIVHRDIKPSNVLLSADGLAKLSDFGIARDLSADTALTQAGVGLGTLAYMAPEQFSEAHRATSAADVYGLGATLYHLLAGRPPFSVLGLRPSEAMERIRSQEAPPLDEVRPEIPREVAEFIARMLAKRPQERPGPASVLEAVLARLRDRYCARDPRSSLWDSSTITDTDD